MVLGLEQPLFPRHCLDHAETLGDDRDAQELSDRLLVLDEKEKRRDPSGYVCGH